MPACFVCGSDLSDGARSCAVCGSSQPDAAEPAPPPMAIPVRPITSGRRTCPVCAARYGDGYRDSFCACGAALTADPDAEPDIDLVPLGPLPALPLPADAGVARLVVYSADRQPIHTFVLDRDVTRVGRTDAVRGDFVDLDLGRLFDDETARKISRKHCLVLRSREARAYVLRPLARNTGTQVGSELAAELLDHPLADGTRIVLGGAVRMKFVLS